MFANLEKMLASVDSRIAYAYCYLGTFRLRFKISLTSSDDG